MGNVQQKIRELVSFIQGKHLDSNTENNWKKNYVA